MGTEKKLNKATTKNVYNITVAIFRGIKEVKFLPVHFLLRVHIVMFNYVCFYG